MKMKVILAACALTAAHHSAHAVFFFFLPLGAIADAGKGQHCAGPNTKVGDTFPAENGYTAHVVEVNGPHERCQSERPIRVKVEMRAGQDVLDRPFTQCVGPGSKVGDVIKVTGIGDARIERVGGNECGVDLKNPVSATLLSVNATKFKAAPAPAPSPSPPPTPLVVPVPSAVPVVAPSVPALPVAPPHSGNSTESAATIKLRELQGMLKAGLISQDDYDFKKAEILKSF